MLEKKNEEEIKQCVADQKSYCEEHKLPHFAPANGRCWSCGKNIYQNYERAGYIGKAYITGCPHCHRSFCD